MRLKRKAGVQDLVRRGARATARNNVGRRLLRLGLRLRGVGGRVVRGEDTWRERGGELLVGVWEGGCGWEGKEG